MDLLKTIRPNLGSKSNQKPQPQFTFTYIFSYIIFPLLYPTKEPELNSRDRSETLLKVLHTYYNY